MFMRATDPRFRIAARLCLVTACLLWGCSQKQEELKLDPGASPFFPGPVPADAKTAAGMGRAGPTDRTDHSDKRAIPDRLAPINTTLGANEVERQLRLAQRAARDGDLTGAGAMLDRVLAAEPNNREALVQRAALALGAFYRETDLADRLAAIAKAGELARAILRANEVLKNHEIDVVGRTLYAEIEARLLEGRIDQALAALKKANDLGFNAVQRVEADKKMAALRSSPQFGATKKAIDEAIVAQARERIKRALDQTPKFAFDFTLADPDGKKVSLTDFKGKVVLVDFWGTWCSPCRQSLPALIALYRRHHPNGLEIVGLNYEKDADSEAAARELVRQAKKHMGIPYPCLMGDDQTRDRVPGFGAFPTSLLIDRSGKVRMLVVGYDEKSLQKIADAIIVMLSEKSPGPAAPKAKR
ncbi:MAG: redoxin domain-containing protein [Isosphaeraceae bacterium]